MIKARQVGTAEKPSYEAYLVNPITEAVSLDADDFESIDEIAHFVADLRTAVTDTFIAADDVKKDIEIVTEAVIVDEG